MPSLILLSAHTGKPLSRPRKGQKVIYAVKEKRKIQPLSSGSQSYNKKLADQLQSRIQGRKDYVIYEQYSRELERDKHGKPVPRKDSTGKILYHTTKAGKKIPEYRRKTRIALPRTGAKQRPVLFKGAKRLRELGIGFQTMKSRDIVDHRRLILIKPNKVTSVEFELYGKTLRDAFKNLHVELTKHALYHKVRRKIKGKIKTYWQRKNDLSFSMFINIFHPDGTVTRIPASAGAVIPKGFESYDHKTKEWSHKVERASNLQREMAHAVRHALLNHGYRFTRTVDLAGYVNEMKAQLRDFKARERKAKTVKLKDKLDANIRRIEKGLSKLQMSMKGKRQLNRDWRVVVYVRFELLPSF